MKALRSSFLYLVLICGAVVLGAQAPQWQWAVRAGGTEWDIGQTLAIDSQGNQYVIGRFDGTATFGSQTLTSNGYDDIFIAKLDPSGNWLWAVQAGGIGDEWSRCIALDGENNVYVGGSFEGTAAFGSQTLTAGGGEFDEDIFVAKLDASGNWIWVVQAGGTDYNAANGIALDGAGNAYVNGYFHGTATFGNHTLTAIGEEDQGDLFVAKLDASGNWLWAVQAGGPDHAAGTGIAVDSVGNIWITGIFAGTATFGSHTLTASGVWDTFVAKLDSSGNWLQVTKVEGTYMNIAYSIALDGVGNAWVIGCFNSTATFGSHTLTASGGLDIFIAKLDPSGNWLWAVQAGGTDNDYAFSITLDGSGNAYMGGVFQGIATIGSHTLTSVGGEDIFVAKLDPSGNWHWVVQAGGTENDEGGGIALDGSDNACVTGYFRGTAFFGSHFLTSHGTWDVFVAKLVNVTPVEDELAPQALARLHNAYPNPLNRDGSALIKADIPERSSATLSIFNLRGQVVARHKLSSGLQQISFSGEGLPAGVYLYSLQCGDYKETRKLVLLK